MEPLAFSDPNPNRVEQAILALFGACAAVFRKKWKEWNVDVQWRIRDEPRLIGVPDVTCEPFASVVILAISCRRKCCMGFGGAPDHLIHSLEIESAFGISNKYPRLWRLSGNIDNFDPDMDEVPMARFLSEVEYDVEQPDETYLEQVKKKLDDLPMVLDYVSKDTTRWTKREY